LSCVLVLLLVRIAICGLRVRQAEKLEILRSVCKRLAGPAIDQIHACTGLSYSADEVPGTMVLYSRHLGELMESALRQMLQRRLLGQQEVDVDSLAVRPLRRVLQQGVEYGVLRQEKGC
jgi:hypothetical protein